MALPCGHQPGPLSRASGTAGLGEQRHRTSGWDSTAGRLDPCPCLREEAAVGSRALERPRADWSQGLPWSRTHRHESGCSGRAARGRPPGKETGCRLLPSLSHSPHPNLGGLSQKIRDNAGSLSEPFEDGEGADVTQPSVPTWGTPEGTGELHVHPSQQARRRSVPHVQQRTKPPTLQGSSQCALAAQSEVSSWRPRLPSLDSHDERVSPSGIKSVCVGSH